MYVRIALLKDENKFTSRFSSGRTVPVRHSVAKACAPGASAALGRARKATFSSLCPCLFNPHRREVLPQSLGGNWAAQTHWSFIVITNKTNNRKTLVIVRYNYSLNNSNFIQR